MFIKVKMKVSFLYGFQWGQTIAILIYTVLPYYVILAIRVSCANNITLCVHAITNACTRTHLLSS